MGLGRGIFAATIQLTEEAAVPMGAMVVVAEASWVLIARERVILNNI